MGATCWSANATYTLGFYKDNEGQPYSGLDEVPFPVQPYLGNEYTYAEGDQRHRAVLNGIWDAGYGIQLSGIYFYGSGLRYYTDWGGDVGRVGSTAQGGRLRTDLTVVPRNNFVGDPIHRVDLRLQERIPLSGRLAIDGIVEIFNLFDRANFGSYTLDESSAAFGRPAQNANLAYAPRTVQLGFRLSF